MRTWGAGILVAAALAGCGGVGGGAGDGDGKVRIYASLPLPAADGLLRAQQLALADAKGRAGSFEVALESLNATSGTPPTIDTELIDSHAYKAAKDPRAVAYIGDDNSEAVAVSLPRLNHAGLLQLSPAATYTGFTKAIGAQSGEPARFSPTGKKTFGRVIPADDVQAAALVAAVRKAGIDRAVLLDDHSIYGTGLARLVRAAAADAGLELDEDPALGAAAGTPPEFARAMKKAGLRATIYTGCIRGGVADSFLDAAPDLLLFTGDCQTHAQFFRDLGEEHEDVVTVVSPAADLEAPAARDFAKRYEQRYGEPPEIHDYFAYESMAAVLDAIERAGARGDEPEAVRAAFFATRDRHGIVGDYSIDANGDTTLRQIGVFGVRDRRLEARGTITAP